MPIPRRPLVNLTLLAAGCLTALSLAEGAARLLAPHVRNHVVTAGLFADDDDLGWRLRADRSVRHRSQYFDVVYRTNGLAYRDAEPTASIPAGTKIVLFYGDSIVFGWGLDASQRFTDLLEAQLAGTEIWNLAVPGYGLDQQILSYERRGGSLAASDVVFWVSRATLGRNRSGYIFHKHKPRFVLSDSGELELVPIARGANARTAPLYRFAARFFLPHLIYRSLASPGGEAAVDAAAADGARQQPSSIQPIDTRMLERARRLSRRRRHRMRVVSALDSARSGELRRLCEEEGIALLEIDAGDERFGAEDPHWSAHGHRRVAAQLLAQW